MGNFTATWSGLLALLIQFVLPILVGLVTTRLTHPGIKAVLLLLLSAVSQFLLELSSPGSFDLKQALFSAGIGFVIAVAAHFGLWKPTPVAELATDSLVTPQRR
jgi:hypothetical protein